MKVPVNEILVGDALEVLMTLPPESVNCCISSPPYWALRDYGIDGQLGLEKTFEEYIDKLCGVYDEVMRVLRKDGTCFVNLGDTYGGPQGEANKPKINPQQFREWQNAKSIRAKLTAKSLCLIPQRFAIEMVNRGWILRNVIIWHKPNPMPSSAKDRFTVDFEPVYFFVKSNKTQYWVNNKTGLCIDHQPLGTKGIEGIDWDWQDVGVITDNSFNVRVRDAETDRFLQGATKTETSNYKKPKRKKISHWRGYCYHFEPQYEPHQAPEKDGKRLWTGEKMQKSNSSDFKNSDQAAKKGGWHDFHLANGGIQHLNPLGRNKRTVWTIPTQAEPEAHFATFPDKLVEPMIKAGCPEFVCKKCGMARERIIEQEKIVDPKISQYRKDLAIAGMGRGHWGLDNFENTKKTFKGYSDCGCNAGWRPGIAIDPFCGTATVCKVAAQLGRDYIGIDLKEEYVKDFAIPKVKAVETGVSVKEQKKGQMGLYENIT